MVNKAWFCNDGADDEDEDDDVDNAWSEKILGIQDSKGIFLNSGAFCLDLHLPVCVKRSKEIYLGYHLLMLIGSFHNELFLQLDKSRLTS